MPAKEKTQKASPRPKPPKVVEPPEEAVQVETQAVEGVQAQEVQAQEPEVPEGAEQISPPQSYQLPPGSVHHYSGCAVFTVNGLAGPGGTNTMQVFVNPDDSVLLVFTEER